jgi:hypothetical protein
MKWSFPLSNYSERKGFNDAGIETFKGAPLTSLSREICQNSLDARYQNESVVLEFSLFDLSVADIPDVDVYKNAITQSRIASKSKKDNRPFDFFKRAIDLLDKPTIRCLRVSDYNTTGLRGSDKDRDTDWCNLVKSSGSSDKGGKAGGSFGIGKFATFACSEMRTVFYSTIDIENNQATQGVSRFVSFRINDESEDETQGIGYLGMPEKNRPYPQWTSFQKGYHRNHPGTDIYILGFVNYPDWDSTVLVEIIDGFMYAILEGHLEVKVHNTTLNKSNIGEIISKLSDKISMNTKAYYQTFQSKDTKWFEEDFENKGIIKIGYRLMDEPSPKKVAMIRMPGMKVREQDKLSNFASFAGVMVILGDKLNEFLRKIENPEHNSWQADRATTPLEVRAAKNILEKLKNLMKSHLHELLEGFVGREIDLPGLDNYFPDVDKEGEMSTGGDGGNLSPKPTEVKPIRVDPPRVPLGTSSPIDVGGEAETDDPSEDGEGFPSLPGTTGGGIQKPSQTGGNSKIGIKTKFSLPKTKFYRVDKNEKSFEVTFTVSHSIENPSLKIHLMGEQSKEDLLPILYAAMGGINMPTNNNEILLPELEQGKTYSVTLITSLSHAFSVEVGLYGNQK